LSFWTHTTGGIQARAGRAQGGDRPVPGPWDLRKNTRAKGLSVPAVTGLEAARRICRALGDKCGGCGGTGGAFGIRGYIFPPGFSVSPRRGWIRRCARGTRISFGGREIWKLGAGAGAGGAGTRKHGGEKVSFPGRNWASARGTRPAFSFLRADYNCVVLRRFLT